MDIRNFEVNVSISEVNQLHAECHVDGAVEYCYYVYWQDERVANSKYSKNNSLVHQMREPGNYYVKAFARDAEGNKISQVSETVACDASREALQEAYVSEKPAEVWISDVNRLNARCQIRDAVEYSYYVYHGTERVANYRYSGDSNICYQITAPGEYYVKVFAKDAEGNVTSGKSDVVRCDASAEELQKAYVSESAVDISITEVNKLKAECRIKGAILYAYYIYYQDKCIAKFNYSENNSVVYWVSDPGDYYVKVFAQDANGEKIAEKSERVHYDATSQFINEQEVKKKNVIENIMGTIKEIKDNFSMMLRMTKFDYQLENKDTYLGKLWAILTPLIQIGTYWFVFGIGLRNGKDVDGFPYLAWMLLGLIPWFFISASILKGANSIYLKSGLISKMKFPIAVAPIGKVLQELYEFVIMLIIMFVILLCLGVKPGWSWLNLIYYMVYCLCFLVSLALVTSVFTMVARDFYKLLSSLIRLLFYVTPILWVMDNMPQLYQDIMQYNPIFYVVNGFRESVLYGLPFYHRMDLVMWMWAANIVLFLIGCSLQAKFKNKFIDLI